MGKWSDIYPLTKKTMSKSTLLFPSFPQFVSGNPVFSLGDSCWSLSRASYGAGMTAYEALLMKSLVTNP